MIGLTKGLRDQLMVEDITDEGKRKPTREEKKKKKKKIQKKLKKRTGGKFAGEKYAKTMYLRTEMSSAEVKREGRCRNPSRGEVNDSPQLIRYKKVPKNQTKKKSRKNKRKLVKGDMQHWRDVPNKNGENHQTMQKTRPAERGRS